MISPILEPVKLVGEGKYNLNALKEIEVTDSYLGIDQGVRGCQNEEPLDNCTTRLYIDTLLNQCGCITFNTKISDRVYLKVYFIITLIFSIFRDQFAPKPNLTA